MTVPLSFADNLGGVGSCCTGSSNLVTAGFGEDGGDELVVVCTNTASGAGSGLEIVVGAGHKSSAVPDSARGDIGGRNGDACRTGRRPHVGLQLVAAGG